MEKFGRGVGGAHMVVWRKELVPLGSETAACAGLQGGQWELGVDPPPRMPQSSPSPVQSHFGVAGRVGAVLSSRKTLELKQRASLPLRG